MWLEIPVDLETEAANVHLLKELDRWIDLGLVSEGQAISLGRKLCSPIPIAYQAPAAEIPVEPEATLPSVEPAGLSSRPFFSRFKSHLVQSFLAEVSVLWLLFLGVFLVVVSSGVLAASQWQSFSTIGQYAILLVYTLAFGGASLWTVGQAKLQTTAQMLKAATLLLVPLNLWMMDALGLVNASVGLAIVASVGLSVLTLVLAPQKKTGFNLLGLSWLHWGWVFAPWPLVAAYLGTMGSAANLWVGPNAAAAKTEEDGEPTPQFGGVLVAIALLILLVRSLWIAQVPITQLGLAIGICGWMLCRLWQYPLWPQLGAGLMLLGWLVSVEQQPLQAIGISGLASWLLVQQLQRHPQERDQLRTLATLWLVGLQTCGLMWLTLPLGLRQILLMTAEKFGVEPVGALNFAGVWLYGYVGLMMLGARQFKRRGQATWALLTEQLALGISVLLVLCTLSQLQSFLFTLSVMGLTLTLSTITRLRSSAANGLIYGTHGAALLTVLSGIYVISTSLGGWSEPQWAMVFLGLTTVEWLASVATQRYPQWRQSALYLGIGLSVMAYSLLLNQWGSWITLSWLVVPTVLSWLVYRSQWATERSQLATILTGLALGGQLLLISSWPMATVVFGIGAGLLVLHSCRWPTQRVLPALAVGFGVCGGHTAAIWLWLMSQVWPVNIAQLCLVTALVASTLSILARPLNRQPRPLLKAYGATSRGWSRALAIALSLGLTLIILWSYGLSELSHGVAREIFPEVEVLFRYGAAATTLLLARFFTERRLTNLDCWELAYEAGLLVALGLSLWRQEISPPAIGIAMVALGLCSQLLGTVRATRTQSVYPPSWHYIPLAYGALGLGLTHLSFTSVTGLSAIVVGVVTLAISSRQDDLHPLSYGGLGLLSLGIYELVIYRMLQVSGGEPGDGLTLLGLVGGAIALFYLLGQHWIRRYSKLTATEISVVSLLHWLMATVLAAMAMGFGHSRPGLWLWLGLSGLLTLYAGLRGNYRWFPVHKTAPTDPEDRHDIRLGSMHHSYQQWIWSSLIIATIAIPYGLAQLLPNLTLLREWGALLACGLSLSIHRLPWPRWGWPLRPWQRMALSWPMLAIFLSMTTIATQSLLLVGAFYAFMAKQMQAVRLSYLSLGLLNWSLWRYLIAQGWLTPLGVSTMLGISALYVLEIDPRWQPIPARQERHRLRSLATLLIGLTAMFQAEAGASMAIGIIGLSLLISFGFITLGLITRVRAYLYVGTLTFILQILRTITLFISTDGRLLWAIGIVLGITLIWVAATFEARRAQIGELLSQWSDMLQNWE
ncbi:hypothetical protein IQ260_16435 [Leptolyngbya cf. ectocarpi LEGE 11479]|uniref:DUF2157 domain-containing protein n=1 Tax=Leptolyngbya cf. ectocarpi LEGE 11479 TaxID=1828722 RepID=A0A929F6K9_LEPEC|nr:hypothetical protein [Leptolyngbya ectocarpi]MBE9068240.1 hypothetical protein [Leptolyngbya cf. ectocarpi LEGE 11479]